MAQKEGIKEKLIKVFRKNIIAFIGASLGWILFVFAIVDLVIGAKYMRECHIEPRIPLWLVVNGTIILGIITAFIAIILITTICGDDVGIMMYKQQIKKLKANKNFIFGLLYTALYVIINFIFVLSLVFLSIWLIVGSVWIYSKADQVKYDNSTSTDYCPTPAYRAAFWNVTIAYIFIGTAMLIGLIALVVKCFFCGGLKPIKNLIRSSK